MLRECPHESAVLDAILSDNWSAGCPPSLLAHVEACDVCRDLTVVAAAVHGDFEVACATARVPSAGAVWWRAQMRARAEGERRAMRPMLIAAACGLTVLVALTAGALTLGLPWLTGPLADALGIITDGWSVIAFARQAEALAERWLVYAVLAAVLLLAAPVALLVAAWDSRA